MNPRFVVRRAQKKGAGAPKKAPPCPCNYPVIKFPTLRAGADTEDARRAKRGAGRGEGKKKGGTRARAYQSGFRHNEFHPQRGNHGPRLDCPPSLPSAIAATETATRGRGKVEERPRGGCGVRGPGNST